MTQEQSMRNSTIYKVLEDLDNSYEYKGSVQELIDGLFELIRTESPEVYELYQKDMNHPDYAGDDGNDKKLRQEFAQAKKDGLIPVDLSFEDFIIDNF